MRLLFELGAAAMIVAAFMAVVAEGMKPPERTTWLDPPRE
jgi:hypothetical protein